jgi:hypothetical protein
VRTRLLLWSCACLLSCGLGPAAWAQSGVQIDPSSPAGTEYELPVDGARKDASPNGPGGAGTAPLFGAGVGTSQNGSRAGAKSSAGSGSRSGRSAAGGGLGATAPKVVAQASAAAPGSGTGQLAAIGAGAAGVLLLGGLAGLFWRRRSGEH